MEKERVYATILDQQGTDWVGIAYENITSKLFYGFAHRYLFDSADHKNLSSSAKLDIQKGTTNPQLIFACCWHFPKKEALEKLVELGKRSETGENVTKSLLEFQNNYGFTCLTILFSGPGEYVSETEKLPPQLMLRGIEECCEYLIDLAKFYNLDLKKILNQTTKAGLTVFHLASKLSEKLTRRLIEENVQVNSINNYFVTPYFRVSN